MVSRRAFVGACGALAGLALGVATLSATANRVEYLTFSGPVSLPGVTLHAGTYSFETLDLMSPANVVNVRDRATRQSVFLGMADHIARPSAAGKAQSIVLGEASRDAAAPIIAWFPNGDTQGYQFRYPRR
jgi:hypothetical protein